jgi:putative transposase
MHLTLKREATKPASANVLQQQARFDTFVVQYKPLPERSTDLDRSRFANRTGTTTN